MPWPVYAPRMAARLFVPALGLPSVRVAQQATDEVFKLDVRPTKARWLSNPYNEADELDLTLSYDESGIDPRYLKSAEVYFWLADADPTQPFTPSADTQRFVGIVREVGREFNETVGKVVTMRVQDYTCLFLEMKTYPASQLPRYTDTLLTAWQRVCDNTGYLDLDTHTIQSSVSNLRDRITFQGGVQGNTPLGKSVPNRIAQLGHMQAQTGTDAWAVWRTVCESLGLITFIRGDRCIVTTATDYFTASDPPLFVWGMNVLELKETRDLGQVSGKGVCVRSYDPLSGTTLESLYPPSGDALAVHKKKIGASAKKAPKTVHTQDYETFDLPFPVADQETLDNIGERVWQERTRQELRGELVTREMEISTASLSAIRTPGNGGLQTLAQGSTNFDLLQLQAGDQIQVKIERDALDAVQGLATVDQRVGALVARGYSEDMAQFIAANLDSIDKLSAFFLVHTVEVTVDSASNAGQCAYDCRIEFVNRVDISGSGAVTTQAPNTPPVTGANQPTLSGQQV